MKKCKCATCFLLMFFMFWSFVSVSFAQDKLKVGVIIPLSGSLAEYGAALKNAVDLVKIESPQVFEQVDIIYEDSQSDPKLALSAFNQLAATPVDIVYVWGATPSEVIAPVAESKKIPLLTLSVSPTVAKDRQYVVRTVGTADEMIAPLAKYLKNSKYKKIALAKTQWTYTEELAKALKNSLKGQISIADYDFSREELDFRSAILKIGEFNPDVMGVFLGSSQVSAFFQQQNQLKQKYPSFGADFFASQKEIDDSGPNIEGAIFPHYLFCEEFTKKYRSRFGNDTHIAHAVNLFDMIRLLGDRTSKLKVDKRQNILELLKSDQNFNGFCSKFNYRHSIETGGYFDYPTSLYQIKDSKVVILKEG